MYINRENSSNKPFPFTRETYHTRNMKIVQLMSMLNSNEQTKCNYYLEYTGRGGTLKTQLPILKRSHWSFKKGCIDAHETSKSKSNVQIWDWKMKIVAKIFPSKAYPISFLNMMFIYRRTEKISISSHWPT